MQCDFEKSCATFGIVISLIVPILIGIALLVTVIVMAVQKKPKQEFLFYVYYLLVLVFVAGSAYILYNKYPGIYCGFFIIFILGLYIQPILNFTFSKN